MSHQVVSSVEPGTRPGNVALLDCGKASRVTKGFPFFLLVEFGWPPFDRLLL